MIKLDVWYKILPAANAHIATENHKPKLNPNKEPAIINPMAIKNPTDSPAFKKEKSFFVTNTIDEIPTNNPKVTMAACSIKAFPLSV